MMPPACEPRNDLTISAVPHRPAPVSGPSSRPYDLDGGRNARILAGARFGIVWRPASRRGFRPSDRGADRWGLVGCKGRCRSERRPEGQRLPALSPARYGLRPSSRLRAARLCGDLLHPAARLLQASGQLLRLRAATRLLSARGELLQRATRLLPAGASLRLFGTCLWLCGAFLLRAARLRLRRSRAGAGLHRHAPGSLLRSSGLLPVALAGVLRLLLGSRLLQCGVWLLRRRLVMA